MPSDVAIDDPICVGCSADLEDDETEVGFCRPCQAGMVDDPQRCANCLESPCPTPRSCGADLSADHRADAERDER